ncbi:MAG: ubiquitin-like domain-containing protein, partial [Anaerolineae bacterium]
MATESITAKRITWTLPTWLSGLLALALVAGGLGLLFLGWQQTASPLVVEVDGRRHELRTHATTVGEALRRAGFDLYPEDRVAPGRKESLQPGMTIRVKRARLVTLRADGRSSQLRTHATTVGGLLAEAGVRIGPGDELWLDERLVADDAPLGDDPARSRTVSSRGVSRHAPEAPAT